MARRRRQHRLFRVIGWVLFSLLALVVLAIATVVFVLHTDWGREQVRAVAEAQLQNLVDGKVKVGKITGSPLSEFVVHGLSVTDKEGKPVVTVGSFALEWEPFALLEKRFHARSVEIDGPVVSGARQPDGTLNLAHILKPKTEPPSTEPSPWRIAIDKLVVRDGVAVMPVGPKKEHMSLTNLEVDATGQLGPDTPAVTLKHFYANWIERGLPIDARGRVVSAVHIDQVTAFAAHVSGSRVSVPFALVSPDTGAMSAIVGSSLREAELFHFWPHPMGLGDATFTGVVARADDRAPFEGRLHASALHGQMWASVAA